MSENQNNPNGQQNFNFDFSDLYKEGTFEKDVHVIAQYVQQAFGKGIPNNIGQRATSTSQSSIGKDNKWTFTRNGDDQYRSRGDIFEDFENGIKKELLDSLAQGGFKQGMQRAMNQFVKEFGFDIRDLPYKAGQELSKNLIKTFSKSKTGQKLQGKVTEIGNSLLDKIFKNSKDGQLVKDGLKNVLGAFKGGGQGGVNNLGGMLGEVIGKGGKGGGGLLSSGLKMVGQGGGGTMTAAGTKLAGMASKAGPWGLLIAGIIMTVIKILGPTIEGFVKMVKSLGSSFNREEDMRRKRLENAQERLKADITSMVEQPFKIMEEAAKKWESAWDSNLRTIGQTQGYDKEAVYALYEGYADRLREDNLASVISATDIIDKLNNVLSSGLSGIAAEEFAYEATKLGAAIPTQDFFGYVDTYASIAANAIAQGKTQRQALDEANKQLEDFASNLLYSSRELAGGFSTGLKNSSSLFKDATQIAQTAKTYNASEISGTLTSVSAVIGAVAPDLADSLVNNIVQAALGGNNNSSIVALRSLAGVNAGNTEFLRALAEDPKSIFATLFTNLASMQNMSPDNYMEVAEGLADVFGIDKAALARVDFNYLAKAIAAMNTNNKSLEENLALLESGQTTTSAEQLKAQEINSIILEEGLAYVIDSEAGRMIQEHMWQEQMKNELQESTYAVDLQGSALEFLEGIRKTTTTLLNFLNPIGFISKGIVNMTATIAEAIGNDDDIKEILKLGAVGSNSRSFYNLTTRGKDLELTTSLVEMMGGQKGTILDRFVNVGRTFGNIGSVLSTGFMSADIFNMGYDKLTGGDTFSALAGNGHNTTSSRSRYNWGTVGKAYAKALLDSTINSNGIGSITGSKPSATDNALAESNKKFQEFVDSAASAATEMSYDNWVLTAKDYGISDYLGALKDYGRTEEEIRSYFEQNQAQAGAKEEVARKEDERAFRDETRAFWDYASGTNGIFQTAMWLPFFGDNQKYDTRMDAVDIALGDIQRRIGSAENHTVISGVEELSRKLGDDSNYTVISVMEAIRTDISNTFVSTSSVFQRCLADWIRYIAASKDYTKTVSKSSAWSDLQAAEKDQQTEATLALANALKVFSAEELQKMDPQLQTNALLGEIVVILQSIMQQNNTQAGSLNLLDTMSALGLGMTFKST